MYDCARMNCDGEAVALLSFAPRHAKAWLYDLIEPNPTTGIALCRRHANATVVPMSWQLVDARDPNWAPPEPPVKPLEPTIAELLGRHLAARGEEIRRSYEPTADDFEALRELPPSAIVREVEAEFEAVVGGDDRRMAATATLVAEPVGQSAVGQPTVGRSAAEELEAVSSSPAGAVSGVASTSGEPMSLSETMAQRARQPIEPSLFELPLDEPAVTPHDNWH